MDVRGKRVAVVGLGVSGTAVVEWLAGNGAQVGVSEMKPSTEFMEWVERNGSMLRRTEFGGHTEAFLASSDMIVPSPGVPLTLPALTAAARRGVPVVGEMDLVLDGCPARIVGVTGTNGKTTTTALLGHLLEAGGVPATVAGNIGVPVSLAVKGLTRDRILVLEVSSFQLDTSPSFHPALAVLLNVTPDHLDRYGSFEAYANSKARITANQTSGDAVVLNRLDRRCVALAESSRARVRWFDGSGAVVEGAGISDGWLRLREEGRTVQVLPLADLPLRGAHNVENALAACVAARLLGVSPEVLAAGLRGFKGVAHRLEHVGAIGEVLFVNDSKATNVDAQEKALRSFSEPVVLIAGGLDKGGDFERIAPLLGGRAKAVILIGSATERIERAWREAVPIRRTGSLAEAVREGFELARPRGVVLLSPGCASYDMFRNFEDRGRRFRDAVGELKAAAAERGAR